MPFFMQCHFCQNKFNLPYTAVETTCPNCHQRFRVDHLDKAFTWEESPPPAVTELEDFELVPKSFSVLAPPVEAPPAPPLPRSVAASAPSATDMPHVKPIPKPASAHPATGMPHVKPIPRPAPPPPPAVEPNYMKPVAKTTPAPRVPQPLPTDFEDDISASNWVSPWGLAAFCFAVLALLLASVVGMRILTIALSAVGLVAVAFGIWASRGDRQIQDWIWLALGGTTSGAVVVLALAKPDVINSRWAIDFSIAPSDPNQQVLVPRDYPRDEGKPLSPEEWVDAATEAIRQDELFVRVDSVQSDRLPDKGDTRYLLVHLRLSNSGQGRSIAFAGFSKNHHVPVLMDDSGHAYPFVEQRRGRKIINGPVVYEVPDAKVVQLLPTRLMDYMLVFAAPPEKVGPLKLEVPASAWGRTGVCKFRCPGYFKAKVNIAKGKP